nr:hypothetical protein [uncultured Blautia sp.]
MKMKKRAVLILAVGLCISALTGCGDSKNKEVAQKNAETDYEVPEYEYITRDLPEPKYIEAAEAFSGGDGTEQNPYQIASAAELTLLEELIRKEAEESNQEDYAKASYVLTADIVLNDCSDFEQWSQNGPEYSWRPIGGGSLGDFKGSFDGNGYTISGMYMNLNNESHEKDYGLFDTIWDAKVQNVNLESSYISVSGIGTKVGGIVANVAGESLVNDCTSNIVIEVYDGSAGGVVGGISGGRSGADKVEYTEEDEQRGPFSIVKNCSFGGTIRQKRENSMSSLGGVAAGNEGNLENCVNYGTIYFGARDTDRVGGIVASAGGIISGCENAGTLMCTLEEGVEPSDTSVCAGGIAGKMFMSSTGSKKYMSRLATITNCKNTGTVTGTMSVGGIVGEANNSDNHWCLKIENCTNTGQVTSLTEGNVGGIAGKLNCQGNSEHGNNLVVENCRNEADLTTGMVGGIAGLMMTWSGDTLIKDCINTGNLVTSENGIYSGGILAHWIFTLEDEKDTANVRLEGCSNEGTVTAPLCAGGIVGSAYDPVQKDGNGKCSLEMQKCSNSGEITVLQINGYLGGIAANWGMGGIPSVIGRCSNTGKLFVNNQVLTEEQKKEIENSNMFTLSRIVGGIIGKVGKGLYLSTDNDEGNYKYINSEDAFFQIIHCENTGEIEINDPEEYRDKTGKIVYRNYIGGILGNVSGEKEYSVRTEGCTCSSTEYQIGNEGLSED